MDRTVHKIFPGNETIIPGRFPIFPGSDAIILGQFPLKIASKSIKIEKIEQKIKFFAPAWGLVEISENWKLQIISFFRKLETPDVADRSVSSRQYV